MIEVSVRHRRGAFALDADFAAAGRITALFGRSGSGKSTLVDVIAGLVRPDHGRVVVDGVTLLDTEARVRVPVHRRRIGYVFQEARLMPHLSVRQNLLFGRFFARYRSGGPSLDAVAELLGIAPLLERRPAGLSGGERQRVAIGRALLARPRLLLMDEPLSALDAARKAEILPYVARLRDEARVPIVYVSHAVAEVARLADTVVVLDCGQVAACGPAAEVLRRDALFAGRDTGETGALLPLRVAAHDDAFGLTHLDGAAGRLTVPRLSLPPGSSLRVRVRARDVLVAREAPRGLSARNVLPGTVVAVTPGEGAHARVEIACGEAVLVAQVTRLAAHELSLAPGLPVVAIVKSFAFDEETMGVVEI